MLMFCLCCTKIYDVLCLYDVIIVDLVDKPHFASTSLRFARYVFFMDVCVCVCRVVKCYSFKCVL